MAKQRGAPKKPPEQRRTELLPIRLTTGEKALVDQAAGGKASTWARGILLKAARRKAK